MTQSSLANPTWMKHARSQLGQRELKGRGRHNKVILGYWHEAGVAGGSTDEVPWCAVFVGAMLARGGYRGTGSALARSYHNDDWGVRVRIPVYGCVAVMPRGNSSWQGHVGFVLDYDPVRGIVYLLGGNQKDSVNVQQYHVSRFLGFYAPVKEDNDNEPPSFEETQEALRKDGSRTIESADRIEGAVKTGAVGVGSVAAAKQTLDMANEALTYKDIFKNVIEGAADFVGTLWQYWWVIPLIVAAIALWEALKIKYFRTEDHRQGFHKGRL